MPREWLRRFGHSELPTNISQWQLKTCSCPKPASVQNLLQSKTCSPSAPASHFHIWQLGQTQEQYFRWHQVNYFSSFSLCTLSEQWRLKWELQRSPLERDHEGGVGLQQGLPSLWQGYHTELGKCDSVEIQFLHSPIQQGANVSRHYRCLPGLSFGWLLCSVLKPQRIGHTNLCFNTHWHVCLPGTKTKPNQSCLTTAGLNPSAFFILNALLRIRSPNISDGLWWTLWLALCPRTSNSVSGATAGLDVQVISQGFAT